MVDQPDPELLATCRRLHPRLVAALTLHCGRLDVAEDLAQETLVRVWERWPKVRQADSPDAWAFRVALNLSTSALRRRALEQRAHLVAPRGADRDADNPDSAEQIAVRQALQLLPARQRAAIILRYFADLSVDDTAAAMTCAPGTVKALTSQGIAKLREHLTFDAEGVPLHD